MLKFLNTACVLVLLMFGVPAPAQTLPEASLNWKVTRYDALVKFNPDLTSERELSIEMEALSDQGARDIGMSTKSYNRDLQTLTIAEAYTLKPDGRKIEVPVGAVQTQNGVASGANAVSWPNVSIIQITFSDVRNGDRTFVKWLLSEKKLVLERWATDAHYLNALFTWDNFSFRMEAPESTNMQLIAVGLQTTKELSDGLMKWHVKGKQSAGTLDNLTANWTTSVPRVVASSFLTQEALANAYGLTNNAKVLASADIKTLASDITKGQVKPTDQARAIYNWIQKNVRYVASFIGTGGYVPHDLSTILQLRYGDCKDFQLLFQSLLNAVNIDAAPALINASTPQFEFPDLPIGFDHVITYIPTLGLFVDATAANVPFGALPWVDADRPVAVAMPEGGKLMRTPSTTPPDNEVTSKSVWTIKNNGNATLDIAINTKGYAATEMREQLSKIPVGMTGFAIQRILKQSGWQGKGFAQYLSPQTENLVQNLDAQIELQRLLTNLTKGSIPANPKLAIDIYVERNLQNYSDGIRTFHTICTPMRVIESFEMHFDSTYQILRIPEDREITNTDGIHFSAHYEVKENKFSGWRKLNMSQDRHSCSPDEFNGRKRTLDEIAQHLRSDISFTQ